MMFKSTVLELLRKSTTNNVSKRFLPTFINPDYSANTAGNGASEDGGKSNKRWYERGSDYDLLYEGHIPTTLFQKGLLAVGSACMSLYNPARDDMICSLGESSGYFALKRMRSKMLADPTGRLILREKPRINSTTVDLDYLASLPEDTFGKTYSNWLKKNKVTPDARREVNFIDDVELAYVMQRYRECHDLYHTILGMPTNMIGEVAVKWVEALQTGLPLCVLGGMFGSLRLGPKHRARYLEKYLPWALRVGMDGRFLMNVYFEKHWQDNLDDLRAELNILKPPDP
ncbi:ubiquinone biosynthesis protein COQ4 homolog, mitochondrial-like [Tubulanus polymorphus]|uniref:ubiquinone biosynthesis protein COQ4 homolog, mitochondrial-like n=1 Tax=Tubulanus polymorphus TaxID=672921 RepID=UPI003DA31AB8